MIKAVIFDMDGVLVDTEQTYFESAHEVLSKLGASVDESDWKQFCGSASERFWWGLKKIAKLETPVQELMVECRRIHRKKLAQSLTPLPGVKELLEQLQHKVQLGVATNSSTKTAELTLDQIGLKDYFSYVATKEHVENAKPSPDIYLHVAEKLGVHPKDCIVFEDSEIGVQAAKSAGMYCFAAPRSLTVGADFSHADRVITNLQDITAEELMNL